MKSSLNPRLLKDLAEKYGTPLYVYLRSALERNVDKLADSVSVKTKILYSMKANPNVEVLKIIVDKGCGVEVASGGELEVALACGVKPKEIVFTGPGKTDTELRRAVESRILAINVESLNEIRRLDRICRDVNIRADIAIRVNPLRELKAARIKMGGGAKQFGIDQEKVQEILKSLDTYPNMNCIGIHVYAGTQILDASDLCHHIRSIVGMGLEWGKSYGFSMINVGGGFGVPYFAGQKPLDMSFIKKTFVGIHKELNDFGMGSITVYVEIGRFLVANAGYYVTQVADVKKSRGKKYIVLDGGTNHHMASAGMGRIVRHNFRMGVIREEPVEEYCEAEVVGPLCASFDHIGNQIEIPADTRVGDLFVIEDSGAYCRSASPLNFLSYDWPAEVMVTDNGDFTCIARRVSAMELCRLQKENHKSAI